MPTQTVMLRALLFVNKCHQGIESVHSSTGCMVHADLDLQCVCVESAVAIKLPGFTPPSPCPAPPRVHGSPPPRGEPSPSDGSPPGGGEPYTTPDQPILV